MTDLGLTHVALPAAKLQNTAAFYRKYANMEVVHQREGALWLSDYTRPFVIVFLQSDTSVQAFTCGHLGTAVESRAEVDRLCQLAEAEGCLEKGLIEEAPPIGYYAIFTDPDGHRLEVSFGQEVGLTVESMKNE